MDVSRDGRWIDGPLINEETFSIGSMVDARWSTTAADESMVHGQGSRVDEGLSESNRPSIAESNRPRSVTFSMLCMRGYQMAGESNLKRKPTPV